MSETAERTKRLRDIVGGLEKSLNCNCDLDNWQPEQNTGHSWVCQIHKIAIEKWRNPPSNLTEPTP